MNKEIIKQVHPSLKLANSQIVWFDNVQKINRHGDYQSRILVISTPAVFLLVKRTFPSTLKVSRQIPLYDLKSITLTNQFLDIQGSKEHMVISHQRIIEIASTLSMVQSSIYGLYQLNASNQLKTAVQDVLIQFQSISSLCDRFISHCVDFNLQPIFDQVSEVCKTLTSDSSQYTFTPDFAASPLNAPLIESLILEPEFKTLILKDINFGTFFPHFSRLLKMCKSLNTLLFINTSFVDLSVIPSDFFEKEVESPLNTIAFTDCSFNNIKMKDLFYKLSRIRSMITSLRLDNCEMIPETVEAMFYSIFDSPAFKNIKSLSLNKMGLAEMIQLFTFQLLNCDWILKTQCFKSLKVRNTEVKAGFLLQYFTMFQTGLSELCLSGCNFCDPIPKPFISTFQQIEELDLSECRFTATSLISLFKSLTVCPPQIKYLDMHSIKISDSDVETFYSSMDQFKMNGVQTFIWDNNQVNTCYVSNFFAFLGNQTSLLDLSISNCFNANSDSAIICLSNYLPKANLQRFVMRGVGMFSFKSQFNSVLSSFLSNALIQSLDVYGHQIADDGIKIISELAHKESIIALIYGNTGVTSADVLIKCLKDIKNSKIEFTQWPSDDVKRVITRVSLGNRDKVMKKVSKLKKKFEIKYNITTETDTKALPVKYFRQRTLSFAHINTKSSNSAVFNNIPTPSDYEIASKKEPEVRNMLIEAIGYSSVEAMSDPLVRYISLFNSETSIDKYLSN